MTIKTLETERLILRRARETDAEAYYELWNSPFALRYNCMKPPALEEAAERVKKDAESDEMFYIERREDGAMIGTIGLPEDSLRHRVNSVGLDYCLREDCSGKGYMTEAMRRVLEYVFDEAGVEIVTGRVFSENGASLRVLEKLGFTREGVLRRAVRAWGDVVYDDVLFSLFAGEFRR